MDLKLLVWNIQGIGNEKSSRILKDVIKRNKPSLVVILEPRISSNLANKAISKLKFDNSRRIEARGFSSGIWVL